MTDIKAMAGLSCDSMLEEAASPAARSSRLTSFSIASLTPARFHRPVFSRLDERNQLTATPTLPTPLCFTTTNHSRARAACCAVAVAAACVLVALSAYVGVVIDALVHHHVRVASVDAVNVSQLCNASWSVAATATVDNPTHNDIRLTDLRAAITATVSFDVELLAGGASAAGACIGVVGGLVNSSVGEYVPSSASSSDAVALRSFDTELHFTVSEVVATAIVASSTLLRRGSAPLSLDIAAIPATVRAQQLMSALSNLTDAMQLLQAGWQQFDGCAHLEARATLAITLTADMTATAHTTILSAPVSQAVADSFALILLTREVMLPLGAPDPFGEFGSGLRAAAASLSASGVDAGGESLSVDWTSLSAQLLSQQVSASSAVAVAGHVGTGGLPLKGPLSVSLPPSLQWEVEYADMPLVTLVVQPGTLVANATGGVNTTLDFSVNATLAGSATVADAGAWHSMLQTALDVEAWPTLSTFAFHPTTAAAGTAECTFASLVDSRFLRTSAIRYLLNTSAAAADSIPIRPGARRLASLSQAVPLSGARLIALAVDDGAHDADALATRLTVDFGQSFLGQQRVRLEGALPGLSLLLNTSASAASPAVALSLQPLTLAAGMYRTTFGLGVAVLDEAVVSEQLLPAAVNGVGPSDAPLALELAVHVAAGDTSVLGAILDGLTVSHTVNSFAGLCQSWAPLFAADTSGRQQPLLSSFTVNYSTTTNQSLALTADVAHDWVNVVQLPALAFSVEVDAFAPTELLEGAIGSLSLQLSTLLGWPSQTLQIHALLTLPSASGCSADVWLGWESNLASNASTAASPCWQSYYVGRFIRNLPFDHPLVLRATVGGLTVTFPYRSFADPAVSAPSPALATPDAASFGCEASASVLDGVVLGVVSGVGTNATVAWWMPTGLSVTGGQGMLGKLPLSASSSPTLLVRDVVQSSALVTPTSLTASDPRWSQLAQLSSEAESGSLSLLAGDAINGSYCVAAYNLSYLFTVLVADVFVLPITLDSAN